MHSVALKVLTTTSMVDALAGTLPPRGPGLLLWLKVVAGGKKGNSGEGSLPLENKGEALALCITAV